jgi:hypothetical protein
VANENTYPDLRRRAELLAAKWMNSGGTNVLELVDDVELVLRLAVEDAVRADRARYTKLFSSLDAVKHAFEFCMGEHKALQRLFESVEEVRRGE